MLAQWYEPLCDVEDLINSLLKNDWTAGVDILNIEKKREALRGMGGTMTVEDKKSVKCEKKARRLWWGMRVRKL